jgi:intracellular sulfur oxidation DsrE/DsrF family protein
MASRKLCILLAAVSAIVALAALPSPTASASHLKDSTRKHRIVYQLDDAGVDKAKFVLGNMRNHIKGVGGWDNIDALELVVFGPALKTFVTKTMDPDVRRMLDALQTEGMVFGACGNTMKNFNITLEQLPENAKPLPQGGVVRIMELQERGYAYIRP